MKKKNIAWGLFFIFLAAVYLVISSTGMELGVGLPGIFYDGPVCLAVC